MNFKRYESKPTVRLAHEITEDDVIVSTEEPNTYALGRGDQAVLFKAFQPIETGDFVVYLTEDDVYHCARDVFHERNVVPSLDDAEDKTTRGPTDG